MRCHRFASWGLSVLAVSLGLAQPARAGGWPLGGPLYNRWGPDPTPASYYGYNLDDLHPGYYGGGRYQEYYNYGRGTGLANFPSSLPPLPPPRYYHAPPPPPVVAPVFATPPNCAQIEIRVPADAEIWLNDAKTRQTGTDRLFLSPALTAGQDYSYDVKARWTDNGRPIEHARTIAVQANGRVRVDFVGEPESLPLPKLHTPPAQR